MTFCCLRDNYFENCRLRTQEAQWIKYSSPTAQFLFPGMDLSSLRDIFMKICYFKLQVVNYRKWDKKPLVLVRVNKHFCHEDVVATRDWWSVRMRCQFLIVSNSFDTSRVIAELILPSRQLTILELRWLRNWWETRLLSWPFSDFRSRTALTWGLRWSCYDGWG